MRSFSVVMRGYACRQVGDLFARIDGTLGSGPATGNPVTAAEARRCSCRRGVTPSAQVETVGARDNDTLGSRANEME